jgi:hypothetical protein
LPVANPHGALPPTQLEERGRRHPVFALKELLNLAEGNEAFK